MRRPLLQLIILGVVLGAVIMARTVLRPRPAPSPGATEQSRTGMAHDLHHHFEPDVTLHRHAHGALALGRVRIMAVDETALTRAMTWRLAAHLTTMTAIADITAGPPPDDGLMDADWFVVLGPPQWQDPTKTETALQIQVPIHIGSQPLPGLIAGDDPAWLRPALPFAMTGLLRHRSRWTGAIDTDTVATAMAEALHETVRGHLERWQQQLGVLDAMPADLTVAMAPPALLGDLAPALQRRRPLWSKDGWWPGPPDTRLTDIAALLGADGWSIKRHDDRSVVAMRQEALAVAAVISEDWQGLLPGRPTLVLRSAAPLPRAQVTAALDRLVDDDLALSLVKPLSPWWSAAQRQRWLARARDSLDIDLLLWAAEDLSDDASPDHIQALIHQAWNVLRLSDPLRQDRAARVRRLAEAHGLDMATLGQDIAAWCRTQDFADLDAEGSLTMTISAGHQARWFAQDGAGMVISMTITIEDDNDQGQMVVRHLDARAGAWNQGTIRLGPGDRPVVRRVLLDPPGLARVEIARPTAAPALRITVTTGVMDRNLPGSPRRND